jgi:hypothetical protein
LDADPVLICALADRCRVLLELFTAEWAYLAPVIVGRLLPVVRGLQSGRSIVERYGPFFADHPHPASVAGPSLPPILSRLLLCREELERATELVPGLRTNLQVAAAASRAARLRILSLAEPPDALFETGSQLLAAREAINAAMDAAVAVFEQRVAALDRFVGILRGGSPLIARHVLVEVAEELMTIYTSPTTGILVPITESDLSS